MINVVTLTEHLGKSVLVRVSTGRHECEWPGTIEDAKVSYSNMLYKVVPTGGTGFVWVAGTSFRFV